LESNGIRCVSKAAQSARTPGRYRETLDAQEFRKVLECARFAPLSEKNNRHHWE
jgi:hypothetical protein